MTYIRVLLNLYKMAAVFIILNCMLSWTVFEIFTVYITSIMAGNNGGTLTGTFQRVLSMTVISKDLYSKMPR